MRALRNESGVALVTVLFVGAALTAVTSAAAFTTIKEFEAGRNDRSGATAHGYAEAGIDRFIDYLKGGGITYNSLYTAGCPSNSGETARPRLSLPVINNAIGRGQFTATLEVFDPLGATPAARLTPASCAARPEDAHDPLYVAVTSTGTLPPTPGAAVPAPGSAQRVVRQVLKVQAIGLPVGHYADQVDGGGNPGMRGVSLVSRTYITGRESLAFRNDDPYYRLSDFYPGVPESFWGAQGKSSNDPIPAAAHARGSIWLKQNATGAEFPPTKNCNANNTGGANPGTLHQSLWDGDGSGGSGTITEGCGTFPSTTPQKGFPPTSRFGDAALAQVAAGKLDEQAHAELRRAAQTNGLYCRITSTGQTCTRLGSPVPWTGQWQPADVTNALDTAGVKNFVAYFDFDNGVSELTNSVTWKAGWGPCSDDPATSKSATIIVRRGSVSVEGNIQLNGALIADGSFKYAGGPAINGTIIAQQFVISGGAAFTLDECWVRNMPSNFLGLTPVGWSEIDR